ncbi:MAG TPA: cysteine-rich CWC family protein [Parasegetibacter sp.]|jgi:hypothetical protein
MPKHEPKKCPRCLEEFQCKVGDIANCECTTVNLSSEEKAFVEDRYNDCLCINCLKDLKQRYVFFREKYWMNQR